jgi:hypothetical protein
MAHIVDAVANISLASCNDASRSAHKSTRDIVPAHDYAFAFSSARRSVSAAIASARDFRALPASLVATLADRRGQVSQSFDRVSHVARQQLSQMVWRQFFGLRFFCLKSGNNEGSTSRVSPAGIVALPICTVFSVLLV